MATNAAPINLGLNFTLPGPPFVLGSPLFLSNNTRCGGLGSPTFKPDKSILHKNLQVKNNLKPAKRPAA
jgi:hypothetical protein